jgi:hypothetical protein
VNIDRNTKPVLRQQADAIYDDYGLPKITQANRQLKPHEQLLWHHDFNYTPMSERHCCYSRDLPKDKTQRHFHS